LGPLLDLVSRVPHQEPDQRGPKICLLHAPERRASSAARRLLRRSPRQREGRSCCTRSRHRRPRNACSGLPSAASTATKIIAVTPSRRVPGLYRRPGPACHALPHQ
jgi:hypothetical protein